MRFLSLFFILFGLNAWAQQEFFSAQNKTDAISYYKDRLYRGCSDLKEEQEAISPKEMKNMVALTTKLVEEQYSQAFLENPKVKDSFQRDLLQISKDQTCQKVGNDCRARLLGLSIYYYQTFRADLPGCHGYKSVPPMEKGFDQNCEVELKFRKATLQGVQSANYGMPSAGTYRKWLVKLKNDTTMDLFNIILRKDRQNLHICNSVQSGIVHQYALELDEPGSYFVGLDPDYVPEKNPIKECVDEKVTLYSEFVPTSFDEGRSTVGADQIEPVKVKIINFVKSNPELIVTDISVTASSSKTPFNTVIGGKKVIDPKKLGYLVLIGVPLSVYLYVQLSGTDQEKEVLEKKLQEAKRLSESSSSSSNKKRRRLQQLTDMDLSSEDSFSSDSNSIKSSNRPESRRRSRRRRNKNHV
jgi:hypothetical protein